MNNLPLVDITCHYPKQFMKTGHMKWRSELSRSSFTFVGVSIIQLSPHIGKDLFQKNEKFANAVHVSFQFAPTPASNLVPLCELILRDLERLTFHFASKYCPYLSTDAISISSYSQCQNRPNHFILVWLHARLKELIIQEIYDKSEKGQV